MIFAAAGEYWRKQADLALKCSVFLREDQLPTSELRALRFQRSSLQPHSSKKHRIKNGVASC